jgi:hypothetical protein
MSTCVTIPVTASILQRQLAISKSKLSVNSHSGQATAPERRDEFSPPEGEGLMPTPAKRITPDPGSRMRPRNPQDWGDSM